MTASAGRRRRRRSAQDGFTLVEVLIAILLSVVAIVGMMGLYRVQTTSSSFSRHNTEATALAENEIEGLRTLGTTATPGSAVNVNAQGSSGGIYTVNWSFSPISGYEVGSATVTVQWVEEGGSETVSAWGQW
jgi:prepilin-type N-terminal cleavage/methylation domain-containing protein